MATTIDWGHIKNGSTFESLVSALILFDEDPQAYPFGRPGRDDGQDVLSGDRKTVYQAKYHRDENVSTAIRDAIKEAGKIKKYRTEEGDAKEVWEGVKNWVLVSNVAFNPRNLKRWREDVEPEFKAIGLTATFWEKEEIETRLNRQPELRRSYFENETRVFLSLKEAKEQLSELNFYPKALDTKYCGTDDKFQELENFFKDPSKRIILVHGPGGIGKTRFILEAAERLLETVQNWQIFWGQLESMEKHGTWFEGIVPERQTLLLLDEPKDETILKLLVEQSAYSTGRCTSWKIVVAVRTPKDPVLRFSQNHDMKNIIQELKLEPLEQSFATALCAGLLQESNSEFTIQPQTAGKISAIFQGYPVWMVLAIKLLEETGNLNQIINDPENFAQTYLREIVYKQIKYPPEKIEKILQWLALLGKVNTENDEIMHFIVNSAALKNQTELKRCLISLVDRKVVFKKGIRDRFYEIKPDVISDHLLREWLLLRFNNQWEPTDDTKNLVNDIYEGLERNYESDIYKAILRSFTRLELLQRYLDEPVELLESLLNQIARNVTSWNVQSQMTLIRILEEIVPACGNKLIPILRSMLQTSVEPVEIKTIFGIQQVSHNDIVLSMPWLVLHMAMYASKDERKPVFSLLCELVIAERKASFKKARGLPNDGSRANDFVKRVIGGGPDFNCEFESVAYESAKSLLENIKQSITQEDEWLLEALVKPLLSVERESIYANRDNKGSITIAKNRIFPDVSPGWKYINELENLIREILEERCLETSKYFPLWRLLDDLYGSIIRSRPDSDTYPDIAKGLNQAILDILNWIANLLESGTVTELGELKAAREVWDWFFRFEKDEDIKQAANRCEDLYESLTPSSIYEPLFDWHDYKGSEQRAKDKGLELANTSVKEISKFIKQGIEYIGKPDAVYKFSQVAVSMGHEAANSKIVREYIQKSLSHDIQNPEFQFGAAISRAWIRKTGREHSNEKAIDIFSNLLQQMTTSIKKVELTKIIYDRSWSAKISQEEAELVYEQYEHFVKCDQLNRFLIIIGGLAFSDLDSFCPIAEKTIKQLTEEQLLQSIRFFVESFHFNARAAHDDGKSLVQHAGVWILDQIVSHVPDIDILEDGTIWHLKELLNLTEKPDLKWLVEAIKKRMQMVEDKIIASKNIIPNSNRLSSLIRQPAETELQLIEEMFNWFGRQDLVEYFLPEYLKDIDPSGKGVSDIAVNKLRDHNIRKDSNLVLSISRCAGIYPINSPVWRTIAYEACRLAEKYNEKEKYSLFNALTPSMGKAWSAPLGQVAEVFVSAVKIAKEQLEKENKPVLRPFWEWQLQCAEAELQYQEERVKEEFEE